MATQHSMWSARRAISFSDLPSRAYAQNSTAAPSTIFSSASQVTTRRTRSSPGVAARAQALQTARSALVGGNVMSPRWECLRQCYPSYGSTILGRCATASSLLSRADGVNASQRFSGRGRAAQRQPCLKM
jgi:hypothetical protein